MDVRTIVPYAVLTAAILFLLYRLWRMTEKLDERVSSMEKKWTTPPPRESVESAECCDADDFFEKSTTVG